MLNHRLSRKGKGGTCLFCCCRRRRRRFALLLLLSRVWTFSLALLSPPRRVLCLHRLVCRVELFPVVKITAFRRLKAFRPATARQDRRGTAAGGTLPTLPADTACGLASKTRPFPAAPPPPFRTAFPPKTPPFPCSTRHRLSALPLPLRHRPCLPLPAIASKTPPLPAFACHCL